VGTLAAKLDAVHLNVLAFRSITRGVETTVKYIHGTPVLKNYICEYDAISQTWVLKRPVEVIVEAALLGLSHAPE
jgi:hypothetical protein